MDNRYTIKVNESYTYSMDESTLKNFDVIQNDENLFHAVANNKSHKIEVIKSSFKDKTFQIAVNGNHYEVKLKNALDQLIKDLGLTINGKQKDSNVKAPMPGIILEVLVKNGQEVKEGDGLMVLEAMKMENILSAPKDGTIKTISVVSGATVEKGELLIEMEK